MDQTTTPIKIYPKVNPWTFTPLLYFMQAIPVTLIQEITTIVYKNLGVDTPIIIFWTSLLGLPWGLQLLLGPFVDLTGSKRQWIGIGQTAIVIGLIAFVFALQLPDPLVITAGILLITGLFSALCNIATDGFYILALSKERQSAFVGLNSTFYRAGRLFCSMALVLWAGNLMTIPASTVTAPEGYKLTVSREEPTKVKDKPLVIKTEAQSFKYFAVDGQLTAEIEGKRWTVDPKLTLPPGTYGVAVRSSGEVIAQTLQGEKSAGVIQATAPDGTTKQRPVLTVEGGGTGMRPSLAWGLIFGLTIVIFALGRIILSFTIPRASLDIDHGFEKQSVKSLVSQTLIIIGLFQAVLIGLGNIKNFLAHFMSLSGATLLLLGDVSKWGMSPDPLYLKLTLLPFVKFYITPMAIEAIWLTSCLVATPVLWSLTKKKVNGTEMGESFKAFGAQSGVIAILGFILFYRFPEQMVGRVSSLFYLDSPDKGGLGLTTSHVGIIGGAAGIVGIIVGGIVGGLTLSKYGLRKCFLPLALAMHLPNALYLWAFYNKPSIPLDANWQQIWFTPIAGIAFVDQFGYGYGFAAYMVYLMWVAQRGRFQTSHYAIGTGLGALLGVVAGTTSGILQQNFGYGGFFWAVLLMSIPSLIVLKLIPLDEQEGRNIKIEEIVD